MEHLIHRLPLEDGISIFLFGDRQEGSQSYVEEAWQEFKNEFRKTKNAYAIGLGDYADWLRPSMRVRLLEPLSHDSSARQMLDTEIRRGHDKIIDKMEFLKGRLLGLHEGHHNWGFASGENTDQRLASALKTTYLGWVASHRLVLFRNQAGKPSKTYTIVTTHGNSNSRNFKASVGWMERSLMESFNADHYVCGHGCKNGNFEPFERGNIRRTGPAGVDRQIVRGMLVGGFTRAFTDGWKSDYVERAGLSPQAMGWGIIRIKRAHTNSLSHLRGLSGRNDSLDIEQVNRNPIF